MQTLAAGFFNLGGWELVAILILGLLLFGRRLPEVGRSLGRGIVEFKRGIKGIEDEIDQESSHPPERLPEQRTTYAAPTTGGQDVRVRHGEAVDPGQNPAS